MIPCDLCGADDPRFVQVLVLALGEQPLGRSVYWPIYAAAERHGFTVGVHAGSAGDPDPFRPVFARWLEGDHEARIEGAESGTEVIERVSAELELVADLHRGESALVVSHGGAICTAVPALAQNLTSRFPETRVVPNVGVVELEADGDGWRAFSWCGEPV